MWSITYETVTPGSAEHDIASGEVTHLSLHIPANLTGASRMRVARLIGCYGVKYWRDECGYRGAAIRVHAARAFGRGIASRWFR